MIDGLLLAVLLVGARFAFRLLPAFGGSAGRASRRAIAYGAGDAGEMLARELTNNPRHPFQLLAFLDDDPYKHGRRIRGIPVVGGLGELQPWLDKGLDAVILASDNLPPSAVEATRAACEEGDVPLFRFSCMLKEVGRSRHAAAGAKTNPREAAGRPADAPASLD